MEIIVVGAGKVGFAIAEKLSFEQHNVVVIDQREERLAGVSESLDCLTIEGSGSSAPTLEKAGIRNADLFIAVTDQDEVNLIACQLARHYGVAKRIARVGDLNFLPANGSLKPQDLGADLIINPEQVCAEEMNRLLQTQAVNESQTFVDGRVALVGLSAEPGNPLLNQTLMSFQAAEPMRKVRQVAIARDGQTLIPRGSTKVMPDDELFFMCAQDQLEGLFEFLGVDPTPPQRVLIVGGGQVGTGTARLLEQQGIEVHLMEGDEERAEEISEQLTKTLVFKGDASSLKQMQNAGLGGVDGFVATCGDDEVNILSCLMAKQFGVRKTLAMVRKAEYLPLLASLQGVDAAVSPRLITASAILRFIRRGKILSAVAIRDIEAEVIEIEVQAGSKVTNKKIKDISFPKDAVMGCIVRGDSVLSAQGEEVLMEKDRVVVLTRPNSIRNLENMFEKKARGLLF